MAPELETELELDESYEDVLFNLQESGFSPEAEQGLRDYCRVGPVKAPAKKLPRTRK